MGEKEFLKLYMKERELKNLDEAKEKIDTFWKTVKGALERGEKVKFKDWGNFDMKDIRPRRIVELKTKRDVEAFLNLIESNIVEAGSIKFKGI